MQDAGMSGALRTWLCPSHPQPQSRRLPLLELVLNQMLMGIQKEVSECRPQVYAHVLEMVTKQCLNTNAWMC